MFIAFIRGVETSYILWYLNGLYYSVQPFTPGELFYFHFILIRRIPIQQAADNPTSSSRIYFPRSLLAGTGIRPLAPPTSRYRTAYTEVDEVSREEFNPQFSLIRKQVPVRS